MIGASGSGKSTLIKILCGLVAHKEGEILIEGSSLTNDRRKKLDFCLQTETMIHNLTVIEHLRFISALKNTPPENVEKEIEELLKLLGLTIVARLVS